MDVRFPQPFFVDSQELSTAILPLLLQSKAGDGCG